MRSMRCLCSQVKVSFNQTVILPLIQYWSTDVPNPLPFTSILSIDVKKEAQCDPARVHCLYGMSKDFGANGLRIGLLVTQHNPALHRACLSTCQYYAERFRMLIELVSPSYSNEDQLICRKLSSSTDQNKSNLTRRMCSGLQC